MDTTIRFLRLEALFGARLEQLQEQHLQHIVDEQLPEDADLDFKKGLYTEAKKLDLATDVAAMANAQGGVVILGVEEDNGRARKLHPLELREGEDRRMREIVARNAAPVPSFRIQHVPSAADPAQGYYLLLVPRSPHAPHAVRVNAESLRYPRRYGAQTLYLAEAEVADAYRSRFLEATSQVAQLDRVHRDGVEVLEPTLLGDDARPWLTLALVPNSLGVMDMRLGSPTKFQDWVRQGGNYLETPYAGAAPQASTGVRRVTVSAWLDRDTGLPEHAYGEFHADGSGFVATALALQESSRGEGLTGISDEALVATMTGMVRLLVDHAASHAGVHGDAVTLATLLGPRTQNDHAVKVDLPIAVLHNRQFAMWKRVPRTRSLTRFPVSRHTISLDSIASNPTERLVATRLVLTDLVQGFGLAELYQVRPTGEIRRQYWSRHYQQSLITEWAEKAGVTMVDTTIDEEESTAPSHS